MELKSGRLVRCAKLPGALRYQSPLWPRLAPEPNGEDPRPADAPASEGNKSAHFTKLVKIDYDFSSVVDRFTEGRMSKLLWVKFGWSDFYRGGPIDGNFPFIKDGEQGHEAWNFLPKMMVRIIAIRRHKEAAGRRGTMTPMGGLSCALRRIPRARVCISSAGTRMPN
ncbi:hypothetical protein [Leisingera sp. ANG-M1]|uniref:hypothetical protein n=1 Tax=Leisingera sp. ANG-M1 TaxID=1577895 RepID=UPI001269B1BA|nr:hypothetical protein [Leisingera sp. ANG-M1]